MFLFICMPGLGSTCVGVVCVGVVCVGRYCPPLQLRLCKQTYRIDYSKVFGIAILDEQVTNGCNRQPASFEKLAKFPTPAFKDTWYSQTRVS